MTSCEYLLGTSNLTYLKLNESFFLLEGEDVCASHLSEGHAIGPWSSSREYSSLLLPHSVTKFYWLQVLKVSQIRSLPCRVWVILQGSSWTWQWCTKPLWYAPVSFLAELIWAPKNVPDLPSLLVPSAWNILLPLVSPLRAFFCKYGALCFSLVFILPLKNTRLVFSNTDLWTAFFCTHMNKLLEDSWFCFCWADGEMEALNVRTGHHDY